MNQTLAICKLGMIPMRGDPKHKSEMVSMLLFGDVFTVLDSIDHWHHIRSHHDQYEGWIFSRSLHEVDQDFMNKYDSEKPVYSGELLSTANNGQKSYYMGFGSRLPLFKNDHFYLANERIEYAREIITSKSKPSGTGILTIAKKYLHTPYLWGGRSLLGIDCSGFTQMVFAMNGIMLPRDASQQAEKGKKVASLKTAKAGDLAFFSETGHSITHVGILTGDGKIIHASDQVRVDKIDENGIFNGEIKGYTLKAALIKRFF
jgi:cell wall-associated NlpC family hydrolase